MLSPETDTEALAKRAFMHLPGVTDEWIKTLEVEKLLEPRFHPKRYPANRGVDPKGQRRFMLPKKNVRSTDQDAPNLADPDAPCLQKKHGGCAEISRRREND